MLPLAKIEYHNISYHSYADDTQLYISVSPYDSTPLHSLSDCIQQVNQWMGQNFLQLNAEKTEVKTEFVFGPQKMQGLRFAANLTQWH